MSRLYDAESVAEALQVVEGYRKKYKPNAKGIPSEVARYNVWTSLKRRLLEIQESLEGCEE